MNARDFAEKFAGQLISWTKERTESLVNTFTNGKVWDYSWPIGTVIGYDYKNMVIYSPSAEMQEKLDKPGIAKLFLPTVPTASLPAQTSGYVPCYGTYVSYIRLYGSATNTNHMIPQWPGICPDCKSPAYVGASMIDCSNNNCKHKYKTNSGLDLFLPSK